MGAKPMWSTVIGLASMVAMPCLLAMSALTGATDREPGRRERDGSFR